MNNILYGTLIGIAVGSVVYLFSLIPPTKPSCFGDFPLRFPHIQAERDCITCPVFAQCLQKTPRFDL